MNPAKWSNDDVWAAIAQARTDLVALLEQLDEPEWDVDSLCEGWRVRDVATHIALGPTLAPLTEIGELIRARGDFNRMVHDTAVARANRPPTELIDELRKVITSHKRPPGTAIYDPLVDILVHTQDIAIPLGRTVEIPTPAAHVAAWQVWRRSFPYGAQKRLDGLRVTATDVDFAWGTGPLVRGPIAAVLLVGSGRAAGLDALSGAGVPLLRYRLEG
ncbi:MAG TPA: maleylpyruvate isomerase family mycothiol-dependent enzyme [Aldersonia sp.]